MKNHAKLLSQPGARRLAVALALCAALLMCLGQAALAQTVTLEGFTFTVPDAFEKGFSESSVFKYTIDNDPEYHDLTVGTGHCCGGEKDLGLTLDWIYEQLEKGDGEYMQNLIHGQPTLFLQAVNEEARVSYALVGIKMNESYLIGFERQTETTQPVGDILLEVMSSAKSYTPQIRKGVASFTPQPTAETTPEPTAEPTPEATLELTLGQKVSIEGFTFSVPDTFVEFDKDDTSFCYSDTVDSDLPNHGLEVGINRFAEFGEFCGSLGVSTHWVYEQLDKGDGEHMQNLVLGQPTLFLQTTDENGSLAMAAVKINGSYIIGGEFQHDTQQPVGELLLKVLNSVEINAPQATVTEEPTVEPTPELTLSQKVSIEGFTFALPDEFEQVLEDDDNGFAYSDKFDSHVLAVGIGHCYDIEVEFGVSPDWIYEQLDKGDGEHIQNLVLGQPTLFLQTTDELGSCALAAVKINGSYIIGGEARQTAQPAGDLLLKVLNSVEINAPQATVMAEPTPEPTPELTLGQKVSIEGFTFSVPDTFEQNEKDENGFVYCSIDGPTAELGVGIGHCYGIEEIFYVSRDWIYEQLDKGDGENMQNLVLGQPTLLLQTADEDYSYALAAVKINGSYIIGGEAQHATQQPAGDLLLKVLSSVEINAPQATATAEPTPEPTAEPTPEPTPEPTEEPTPLPAASNGALLPVYLPEECQAWSYNETCPLYLDYPGGREATDDFLFCGLDWDTDLDTALRTIAANTNRQMEYVENGSYVGANYGGSPFWGLNSNECFLTLITVVPEQTGWWVECQLTPEQVAFEDEQEAAAWFTRVWQSLDWEKHEPPTFTFELEGQGQAVGSAEELISLWQDAAGAGAESVYAFISFNNLTISLEKDLYGDQSFISCWLTLVPGER